MDAAFNFQMLNSDAILSAGAPREHQFTRDLLTDEVPVAESLVLQGKTLYSHACFLFTVLPALTVVSTKWIATSIWSGHAAF